MYPATVACDESASIDCARVIRGTASIANATTPWACRRAMPSGSVSGSRKPISTMPGRSAATSSAPGLPTRTTASAPVRRLARSTRTMPASSYCPSGYPASTPAPRSTAMSNPDPASLAAASGINATRFSPGADSRGTHTRICTNLREGFCARAGNQYARGSDCRLCDCHGCVRSRARRARRARGGERRGGRTPSRVGRGAARGAAARCCAPRRRQGQRPGRGPDEARTARRRRARGDPCPSGGGAVAHRRRSVTPAGAAVRPLPPRTVGRARLPDPSGRGVDPRRGTGLSPSRTRSMR